MPELRDMTQTRHKCLADIGLAHWMFFYFQGEATGQGRTIGQWDQGGRARVDLGGGGGRLLKVPFGVETFHGLTGGLQNRAMCNTISKRSPDVMLLCFGALSRNTPDSPKMES